MDGKLAARLEDPYADDPVILVLPKGQNIIIILYCSSYL